MSKQKNITAASIEALDFIASRLLNFRRIEFEVFRELVAAKFSIEDPEILFYELINKEGAYLWNGMIVLNKEEVVKQFCVTQPCGYDSFCITRQAA